MIEYTLRRLNSANICLSDSFNVICCNMLFQLRPLDVSKTSGTKLDQAYVQRFPVKNLIAKTYIKCRKNMVLHIQILPIFRYWKAFLFTHFLKSLVIQIGIDS